MGSDNTLLIIAIIAAVVSAIAAIVSFVTIGSFNDWLSISLAPTTANQTIAAVNITIQENLAISFVNDTIVWGTGSVVSGQNFANLTSDGRMDNWQNLTRPNVTLGFVLENIGNINASLYLKTDKNATKFIMFDGTCVENCIPSANVNPDEQEKFRYKVRTCSSLEVGGCRPAGAFSTEDTVDACPSIDRPTGFTYDTWFNVNASSFTDPPRYLGTLVCNKLEFSPNRDELRIDINVIVPNDAPSTQTVRGTIMTATAQRQI